MRYGFVFLYTLTHILAASVWAWVWVNVSFFFCSFFHSFDFVTHFGLLNSLYWWRFRLFIDWESVALLVRERESCFVAVCCCFAVLVLVVDVVVAFNRCHCCRRRHRRRRCCCCLTAQIFNKRSRRKKKTCSKEYALDLWHSFRLLPFPQPIGSLTFALFISLTKHFLIGKNCSNNVCELIARPISISSATRDRANIQVIQVRVK